MLDSGRAAVTAS